MKRGRGSGGGGRFVLPHRPQDRDGTRMFGVGNSARRRVGISGSVEVDALGFGIACQFDGRLEFATDSSVRAR